MTTQGFTVSHAGDARFERGLRAFFEYRDLGIRQATQGRVEAHVIRAAAGQDFSSQPHRHDTEFQLVYVLKGWIEFEYEDQGAVRLDETGNVDRLAVAIAQIHRRRRSGGGRAQRRGHARLSWAAGAAASARRCNS